MDNAAAAILAILRTETADPAEGFMTLELAFYLLWRDVTTDNDLKGMLGEFVANVMVLHATNDIKGTA